MTYAPASIIEVRTFLKGEDADLDNVELGIVGGPSHILTGTSYHLGADQLKMSKNPYSARTARDRNGLANPATRDAACALDIDDDLDELRPLSIWLVNQCRAQALDTLDIREIIYSPNGVDVYTWDREQGVTSLPQKRGNSSHRTHTHISWYRDSVLRPKVGPFKRFYAPPAPTRKRMIDMFFLQVTGSQAVYVSDGIRTRNMPAGTFDTMVKPLTDAGAPFLFYPTMEALLAAGGPMAPFGTIDLPDELLVRIPSHEVAVTVRSGD